LSTSPGFTCFRAGFSFFCFGTTAFAAGASTCVSVLLPLRVPVLLLLSVSVLLVLIVWFGAE
jgi:hypothetical protein